MSETAAAVLPRVLIVDDSRLVRASIVKHLEGRFETREESDGEAGWQTLLLDPSIQVLISDLTMPKLDGYGLLKRVRESGIPRIREMPVVVISGDEDEVARNRAKECGATDFINKGIGAVELIARLEALVKLARAGHQIEAMAKQVLVDPQSGLSSEEYLKQQGRQALAMVQRHGGEISIVVVEIQRFEELVQKLGRTVADQLIQQFRAVLGKRVRLEDTVSQTGPARFTVVCPAIGLEEARAFARRLDATIRNATISYRGERIAVGLKFGFANSRQDEWQSMTNLLQLAERRVLGEEGEKAPHGMASSEVPPPLGLEDALALLQAGDIDAVKPHIEALAKRLMPLLRMIDRELGLGLGVDEAEVRLTQISHEPGIHRIGG
jgi:diguanylate cyclase (GGDEF)-like protein